MLPPVAVIVIGYVPTVVPATVVIVMVIVQEVFGLHEEEGEKEATAPAGRPVAENDTG